MATVVQHGVLANPQQILFSDRVPPSPGTIWGLANLPKEALGNHSLWDETFSSPSTWHSREKMKGQGKDFERGSQSQGNRDLSKRRGRNGLGEGRKKAREEGGKEGKTISSCWYILKPVMKVYCPVPWNRRGRLWGARGSHSKTLHPSLVHFSTEHPVCTRQLPGKTKMLRVTPSPAGAHRPEASVSTNSLQ